MTKSFKFFVTLLVLLLGACQDPPVVNTDSDSSDTAAEGTGETGEAGFCECLADEQVSRCQEVKSCETASDCCDADDTEAGCPGQYPYLYACQNGQCVDRGCASDDECSAFPESSEYVASGACIETPTPCDDPGNGFCRFEYDSPPPPQTDFCQTAADCCGPDIPAGYTCNVDHPYRYECMEDGICRNTADCSSDSDCEVHSQAIGYELRCEMVNESACYDLPDTPFESPAQLTCVNVDIWNCNQSSDCCAESGIPGEYTCGEDYPYTFSCEENSCLSLGCNSDEQCDAWAQEKGITNYQCGAVGLGYNSEQHSDVWVQQAGVSEYERLLHRHRAELKSKTKR